ncbi:MAG: hypothetical protein H0X66_07715 [Verrucomicrobia bacterium]|nr:hypothetical protein [Verrucomicrobiota bacterium]
MDNHQAKQLLIDYRPGLAEPTREMTEALALAERDPNLNEWFTGQQRFHGSIRSQLRAIEVPADLKSQILAGRKTTPLWRKHLMLYAAAAALILFIGLETMWLEQTREEISFAGYQNRMIGFAVREYRMDLLSEDPKEIRNFLAERGAPTDYVLPSAVESLPAMGGARLSWQGKPVSMLCYKLKANEIAYLFVLNETALPSGEVLSSMPEFATIKGLNTARWKRGSNVYLLAAPLPENELRGLVQDFSASL